MAKDVILLGEVAAHGTAMFDICCGQCDRHGRLSLLADHGPYAAMGHFMQEQIESCPKQNCAFV